MEESQPNVGKAANMDPLFELETSAKILRQVEFYFSDSNLPNDKFLLKCIGESEDGLISLPLICSFSRMRSLLGLKEAGPHNVPCPTTTAVAELLRKSCSLRVSNDGQKVGRMTQLLKPEEVQAAVDARSIAASPLPWRATMAEVETYFSQYAKVNSVRLPRHHRVKAFCGSALIEFSVEEDAKKVLEVKLVYHGADLELRPKKLFDEETERNRQHFDHVSADYQQFQQGDRRKHDWQGTARDNTGQHIDSYPKGLIVAFTLRKVAEDGNTDAGNENAVVVSSDKKVKDGDEEKPVLLDKVDGHVDDEVVKDKAVNALEEKELKGGNEEKLIHHEDIKDMLKCFGNVKYVDYTRGGTAGYVRFEQPEEAQKARTAAVLAEEGGLVVKDHIATFEAVEGEAEKEYWKKLRGAQDRRREMFGGGCRDKFRRKRGRDGNHQGGRGRRKEMEMQGSGVNPQGKHMHFEEDDTEDEPTGKKQESE